MDALLEQVRAASNRLNKKELVYINSIKQLRGLLLCVSECLEPGEPGSSLRLGNSRGPGPATAPPPARPLIRVWTLGQLGRDTQDTQHPTIPCDLWLFWSICALSRAHCPARYRICTSGLFPLEFGMRKHMRK